jgi:sulfiredoxin
MGAPAAAAAETLRARAASDEDSENFSCGELMLRWEVAAAEAGAQRVKKDAAVRSRHTPPRLGMAALALRAARPRACAPPTRRPARAAAAATPADADAAAAAYGWDVSRPTPTPTAAGVGAVAGPRVADVPLEAIRRPLTRASGDDAAKVAALALSMAFHGLKEPIDILDCDGSLWGFSGCHRYAAASALGWATILCCVRRVSRGTLAMHLR